jgi:hypothetical protein
VTPEFSPYPAGGGGGDSTSEPWQGWLAGGELPSRDFYVGYVVYEGGAMIEYALFGDPDWDHHSTKEVIDDWNDFVEDDLNAAGCTCEHVKVAVFRTDTRTPEERMSPAGGSLPNRRSSSFYYWHSDEDCPANERLTS